MEQKLDSENSSTRKPRDHLRVTSHFQSRLHAVNARLVKSVGRPMSKEGLMELKKKRDRI